MRSLRFELWMGFDILQMRRGAGNMRVLVRTWGYDEPWFQESDVGNE